MIPLGKSEISNADVNSVIRVLESANLVNSNVVQKFDAEFSNYVENKYGIAVNPGTITLYLIIKGMDLKKVVIPAVTCPDVLNVLSSIGAAPINVDVNCGTDNFDLEKLTQKILYDIASSNNSIYFSKENRSKLFNKFVLCDVSLPITENCASCSVLVPIYPSMSKENVDIVIDSIRKVVRNV